MSMFLATLLVSSETAQNLLRHHDLHILFRLLQSFCGSCRRWDQRLLFASLILHLVEFYTHNLADTVLLHRHTIKHIGHANRALVMGNNDELRVGKKTLQHTNETGDVRLIQRRIQLVQNTEGTWLHLVNREEQCNSRHG